MGRDDRGRFAFAAKMRKPPRRNSGRDSPRAPSDSTRPRTAWTPSGKPPVSRNGHRTRPNAAKSLIHKGATVDVPSSTLAHAPSFPHDRAFVELISHFLNCRVLMPQAICRAGPHEHPYGHLPHTLRKPAPSPCKPRTARARTLPCPNPIESPTGRHEVRRRVASNTQRDNLAKNIVSMLQPSDFSGTVHSLAQNEVRNRHRPTPAHDRP